MVLDKWLTQSERPRSAHSKFGVIDAKEAGDLRPEVKSHLVDLLFFSLFDPDDLNAYAEHLG